MNEISDKFIDLGLDEQHSDYGQELMAKTEKYKREFEKSGFVFETSALKMPAGNEMNEDLLDEQSEENFKGAFDKLGHDLEEINNILHSKHRNQYQQDQIVAQLN